MPGEQCIGGGYFFIDSDEKRIILDRESYDFGRPLWHLLQTLKVPSAYRHYQFVYKYDDGFHDDLCLNEELKFEYYE